MAVLGRLIVDSAERLDLSDFLSIDSYTASDFKYLIQSFVGGTTPYILRGFEVIQPQNAIGTTSISIGISDSVAYYPEAGAGSFYYGLPAGNVNAQPLVPELRKNATNFVYLTFSTFNTAKDSRAFWDPDLNSGAGGEFSQNVNTESVLEVIANVSTSTFPTNTIPICKVVVGASVIESIEDCRDMMFRLGTGGISPDPFSSYAFRNNPSSAYARSEPSNTMSSAIDANPFEGGDKNIFTLKEWMDAVMTKLKELGGTTFWYQDTSSISLNNVFLDSLASTLKSKGQWIHSGSVPGQATWTEDIHYLSLRDSRDIVIRASTINLNTDDEVAFIDLQRDVEINNSTQQVSWINGSNFVNGVSGAFVNLSIGDWIRKEPDNVDNTYQVEAFYALPGLAGGTTTPILAQSIQLSSNYVGSTGNEIGVFTKGEYLSSDIQITPRNSTQILNAGGNFYWLAYRSDTSLSLSSAISTQLTIDIKDADGQRAHVTSTAPHGLIDGDRVTITTGPYAGTYHIQVSDSSNFDIITSVTGNSLAQTAFYAIVTTAARVNSLAPSFSIETANHCFQSDEIITIQNSGGAFDGEYTINVRSATTFQIAVSSLIANPGAVAGKIVVLPRLNVRTEFGTVKIVQNETIDIGQSDSQNILSYVGMSSLAETSPDYFVPISYGTLRGHQNYNSSPTDNLTQRTAQLTAMMADRVQDRGMQIIGRTNITSTTSGANQNISALANLTLVKPSGPDQCITLTTPIALPANSYVAIDIDRDGSEAITPIVISLGNQFLLQENRLMLFYRFSDTNVYDWLGNKIAPFGHINTEYPEDSQNRNVNVFNPGDVRLNPSSGLLTLVVSRFPEQTQITTIAATSVPQSSYFTFSDALDVHKYYVWYNKDGAGVDPGVAGRTGIMVTISTGQTATTVASATVSAINGAAGSFVTATNLAALITLTNNANGASTDPADGLGPDATTFLISIIQEGLAPDIEIIIPGSANNTITVDTINGFGTLILADGESIWCRIDRFNVKTFNTIATSDGADTDTNGKLYITTTTTVPIDQDVIVLWTRVGNNILVTNEIQHPEGNVYEEFMDVISGSPGSSYQIHGPVLSGSTIQIPLDSRNAGSVRSYIVGSGQLEVFLNGQYLRNGTDWMELGSTGALSSRIEILQNLSVGDVLYFRVDATGAVYFAASSGGGGNLQAAYNAGRFIAVNSGQPVTITGPSGKLLVVEGDMEVDGVIDPAGITFSQQTGVPAGFASTDYGLYRDASDNLIYARGINPALNISTAFLRVDGTNAMTAALNMGSNLISNLSNPVSAQDASTKAYVDNPTNKGQLFSTYNNNTGSTLNPGDIVVIDSAGFNQIKLANNSSISTSEGVVGVVYQTILNGTSGLVQIAGITNVNQSSSFTHGAPVYVSSVNGQGTSTIPTGTGISVVSIGTAISTTQVQLSFNFIDVNSNVYNEFITVVSGAPADSYQITGPVISGTSITLPLDSRNGGASRSYVVGQGLMNLFLNGQYLIDGVDWSEVGASGDLSTTILINQSLAIGDKLSFDIILAGSTVLAGGGGGGTVDSASNLGSGSQIFSSLVGTTLEFRSLTAGSNVSIVQNTNDITISATGEANTASNLGSGSQIFSTKVGVNLEFRSLTAGSGISIVQNTNDITISAVGAPALNVVTKTTSYTALSSDDVILVDATAGPVTITLPAVSGLSGHTYDIKKIDSSMNSVTIVPNGSDKIDNASSEVITVQYADFTIVGDGTSNWWIL